MYFKKLELVSFKSFYEKTSLHFEPGITAVVGPNGCGKSNIFDSIRWVLGEQSAKSLRGSDMQDVIFNGTDTKEPVGMAEVSLTFDNKGRFFNFDQDEITVTRRIFRSGESEYLLNKTGVRLKDILDLLMGTGIGAESYSMVAQGKIDLVLSSRPEDRRLVFDEASGITKYKSQKRETTRKLEETEQNLLRVNDIVNEVKRQINSLERQANKARKYKEVFEEMKSKEISLAIQKRRQLFKQQDEASKQLKEYEAKEQELLNRVREEEEKISSRTLELKSLEDNVLEVRNKILQLENEIVRKNHNMEVNKERIIELEANRRHLEGQINQVKNRLILDEQKLGKIRQEHFDIKKNTDEKTLILNEKDQEIGKLASSIKCSLENISRLKKLAFEVAAKTANSKNQISDFNAKQQIFLSRKKRLEIEKAKAYEEKVSIESGLDTARAEAKTIKETTDGLNHKISQEKSNLESRLLDLDNLNRQISDLERKKSAMESHKEFLLKLKTEYQDLGASLNAIIYLDNFPAEKVSGLVVRVKDYISLNDEDKSYFKSNFKLTGEAKPVELDTKKIDEKLGKLEQDLAVIKEGRQKKQQDVEGINKLLICLQQEFRTQEIALANKESALLNIQEQFNKIVEEQDLITMELQEVSKELDVLDKNLTLSQSQLLELNKQQLQVEDSISQEQENISNNSKLREEILIVITQIKTELNGLNNRLVSDEATLKILEDTYRQDCDSLKNIESQINETESRRESLSRQIHECIHSSDEFSKDIARQKELLSEMQNNHRQLVDGSSDTLKEIESNKKRLECLRNNLHELEMRNKDIEYKYSSLKDRMLQAYKVDLDSLQDQNEDFGVDLLTQEIEKLKQKLDSYGTVNLVAIEEYDELKKRYDFLVEQQNDLSSAKESLHQAILKINRTTKQMFLETFEKVKVEFRNYFRLLFGGGDAQVFLIDEQDPLESGIEIICRPPGKKLQNVLLLSGGEKSLSAIALIFAIFKVKPSPFCILDEIDAALDEANVDRFSKLLQEFAKESQFIVITHNKRTIVNADVMYGITMEESGISKIVSVKFGRDKEKEARQVEAIA